MPRPNSVLTKLRMKLVRKIDPKPPVGEAWCVDCPVNFGKTKILPADLDIIQAHLKLHPRSSFGLVKLTSTLNKPPQD